MNENGDNANRQKLTFEVVIGGNDNFKSLGALIIPVQDALRSALGGEEQIQICVRRREGGGAEDGQTTSAFNTGSVDGVILPPQEDIRIQGLGFGTYEKPKTTNRRYQLYELLKAEGLDADITDTTGVLRPSMVRKEGYHLVDVHQIDKQILVCDQEGEATFVSDEPRDPQCYTDTTKQELGELEGVHRVVFRTIQQWQKEIRAYLTGVGLEELRQGRFRQLKFQFDPFPPRDKSYYSDGGNVRHDLEKFAEVAGVASPLDLNTSNTAGVIACCANQERVRASTYIRNAGVALGKHWCSERAAGDMAAILKRLKVIAGYEIEEVPPRDYAYYSGPSNVLHDLSAYADAAGLESYAQLNTAHLSIRCTCSNGEEVRFGTYLKNAGVSLKYAYDSTSAGGKLALIVGVLKEVAAGSVSNVLPM